jgi:hypothetical protein
MILVDSSTYSSVRNTLLPLTLMVIVATTPATASESQLIGDDSTSYKSAESAAKQQMYAKKHKAPATGKTTQILSVSAGEEVIASDSALAPLVSATSEMLEEFDAVEKLKENWDGCGALSLTFKSGAGFRKLMSRWPDNIVAQCVSLLPEGLASIEFFAQNGSLLGALDIYNPTHIAFYIEATDQEPLKGSLDLSNKEQTAVFFDKLSSILTA